MKQLLIKLLIQIITLITPELRKTLCEGLQAFREKARQSKNPWDDLAAEALLYIFDCRE